MSERIPEKPQAANKQAKPKKPRKKHVCPLRVVHPPELLARARHLYEKTRTPVKDIWRMLGLNETGFYRRVARFGWVGRRYNPALQPYLSRTRVRGHEPPMTPMTPLPAASAMARAKPDRSCGAPCEGLAACAARRDLILRLTDAAAQQEKVIDAVQQAFLALGGPPHQRQAEGHAWLVQELASAQDTLRALDHVLRARVR